MVYDSSQCRTVRVTFHIHRTRMLASGHRFAVHRGLETGQILSALQCFRFTEGLFYFYNKRGCQAIRPPAAGRASAPYMYSIPERRAVRRIRCAVMARRQLRRPTDRASDRRGLLCITDCDAGRQTRRRTGWAITCSFNTKSAERRNAERRQTQHDATKLLLCFAQKPLRYKVFSPLSLACILYEAEDSSEISSYRSHSSNVIT